MNKNWTKKKHAKTPQEQHGQLQNGNYLMKSRIISEEIKLATMFKDDQDSRERQWETRMGRSDMMQSKKHGSVRRVAKKSTKQPEGKRRTYQITRGRTSRNRPNWKIHPGAIEKHGPRYKENKKITAIWNRKKRNI